MAPPLSSEPLIDLFAARSELAPTSTADDGLRRLRSTMAAFATGVVLVAANVEKEPIGLLVNSFTSVSLTPPFLSLSLGGSSRTLPALERATHWGLSVLGSHQARDFAKLSRRADVRFDGVSTELALGDSRLLPTSAATFVVTREREIDAGDHRLFLLRILEHCHEPGLSPLIFHGGKILQWPAPKKKNVQSSNPSQR